MRIYTVHAKLQPGEDELVTCLMRGDEPGFLNGLDQDGCITINLKVIPQFDTILPSEPPTNLDQAVK